MFVSNTFAWQINCRAHSRFYSSSSVDSYLALAFADAEAKIFQLLASITQCVKSQLFFVYMSIASKKKASL